MSEGYICLVFNAHFPFITQDTDQALKTKLFQTISDTYLPLLDMLDKLSSKEVRYKLTISLSPTLITIFSNSKIMEEYEAYLNTMIGITEEEMQKNLEAKEYLSLSSYYNSKYNNLLKQFSHKYNRDLIKAFKSLFDSGYLDLITTCATHAFIPLMEQKKSSIKTQIDMAIDLFEMYFHKKPSGFWLPECGYSENFEKYLAPHNIDYFILDAHGLIYSDPPPIYGTFSPVITPLGVCAFGRDAESSTELWSNTDGYLQDSSYRKRFESSKNNPTKLQYYANPQTEQSVQLYDVDRAANTAKQHANDFIQKKVTQLGYIKDYMDKPPIILCPFDIELFGSWWYEGLIWLEEFIQNSLELGNFSLTTPAEYLNLHPVMQVSKPCSSSWGPNGYNELWLNKSNDWIYKHLKIAEERMEKLVAANQNPPDNVALALKHALNQLLILQSSHWSFMLNYSLTSLDVHEELLLHFYNFDLLYHQITENNIDLEWLDTLNKDILFPNTSYTISNYQLY